MGVRCGGIQRESAGPLTGENLANEGLLQRRQRAGAGRHDSNDREGT